MASPTTFFWRGVGREWCISLSPPNNLFVTNCPTAQTCSFHPLVDTFTFGFPQPIRAFGVTFSSTFAVQNGDYLLTTDRGDVVPSFFDPLFSGFPLGQFAGFISDEPFNSVRVSSTANALYGMDDIVFARSVPEPSSLVLLSFGLFGLGAGTRRLRANRRSHNEPRIHHLRVGQHLTLIYILKYASLLNYVAARVRRGVRSRGRHSGAGPGNYNLRRGIDCPDRCRHPPRVFW